jgi:hypothetical protein
MIFAIFMIQLIATSKLLQGIKSNDKNIVFALLIYFLTIDNFYTSGLRLKYNSFRVGDPYLGFYNTDGMLQKITLITLFLQWGSSFLLAFVAIP